MLFENPKAGKVMPGSGGLRKIRIPLSGRGKRGGGRVIYYFLDRLDRIYLLFFFPKNEQADLTRDQLRAIKLLLEE